MRRCLVVANRTLANPALVDRLHQLAAEEPTQFRVVVPATPEGRVGWTEGGAAHAAAERLDAALRAFAAAGLHVTGTLGDADPVLAVRDELRTEDYATIVVSTLPAGVSRWLRLDLPHRIERATGRPVVHVEAQHEPAGS